MEISLTKENIETKKYNKKKELKNTKKPKRLLLKYPPLI